MFPYKSSDGIQQYGIVKASYANFGFVPYGHSMVSNGRIIIVQAQVSGIQNCILILIFG